ncbi:MAG: DUF6512 family protein [Bacillota bacterium]
MKAYRSLAWGSNIGLVALIFLGLAFHELYKSTGVSFLGIISPVNESKWEHWKMAFFPMLIIGTLEYYILGLRGSNYLFALAAGSIVFLVVTFGGIELYELILEEAHLTVHVSTFLMGAAAGQFARYMIMGNSRSSTILLVIGGIVIGTMSLVFFRFTFNPPRDEYFRDSISGTYGIHEYR